ncbi:MAG: mechanosensitive ion channel domain-containing protein [Myxococcota bacterium]
MDTAQINELMGTLTGLVATWGLQIIGALAVLIIGRLVAGAIKRSVVHGLARADTDASLIPFLSNTVYYILLTVVIIAVLNLFGVETTSLIAIVGAAGLAIGLALQGTLSNFAAGVMLLIFHPFRKGDVIEAGGSKGSVMEIGVFTTVLDTAENVKIIVPNSAVTGGTIINFSAYDTRRNDLVMGISYDDNIGTAIETINAVLASDSRVLKEPAPKVAVAELADSCVNLVVRPWCNASDYWPLRFDLTRKLKEELESNGCSFPYPQQDVHVIASNESGAPVA